jgi:hypothetical protein
MTAIPGSPSSVTPSGSITNQWNIQAKLLRVQRMRTMVQHYMIKVNPWIPCIDEKQLNSDMDELLAGRGAPEKQLQVAAMVELMMALVQVMTDERAEADRRIAAGWAEFQHAEHLLNHTTHKGVSNLRTIQCLVLKTVYLIYTDREDLAYDNVATMSRLCVRLGLNNQKRWTFCSPTEVHLRQLILWTVFCLERFLAETCRLPYLIRHTDLNVAVPLHLNGPQLRTNIDTLSLEDSNTYMHHLYFCHQWAVLFTDAWDCLLAHDVEDLSEKATVIRLDDQIQAVRSKIPSYLRWNGDALSCTHRVEAVQRFRIREGLLLNLVGATEPSCRHFTLTD